MRHDQLFKAVLQNCFRDFIRLFYPDVAERLDFESVRFLEKELFTDFPAGSRREADVVAEVKTREGDAELVLIHVEVQSRTERDFGRRMFRYYAALTLRYAVPVFPIVVYLQGGSGLCEEEYRALLFGREVLRFGYQSVGLARLDPEEYLWVSPLGAALAALMSRTRLVEPLKLRVAMYESVLASPLTDAQKGLLAELIESYFELTPEEAQRFRQLVPKEEYRKMEELGLTWSDKIELRTKRETLLKLLAKKFGPIPEETAAKVNAVESFDEIDAYLERILTASSLEEMGLV